MRIDYMVKKSIKIVQENSDWIQIVPHGVMHFPREFEMADKTATLLSIKGIDKIFHDNDVQYEKGFKAPYWLWNENVVSVLDNRGWWGAVDRNQPEMLKTKRFFKYNYSISDVFWESDKDLLKLHGHMDGTSDNDIVESFMNLMKMPQAEFVFVSELLEDR